MDPAAFIRGAVFEGTPQVPYPRAKPGDGRIPGDTWYMSSFPVGVRLELAGDAEAIDISYETRYDEVGWPGPGGHAFDVWRGGRRVAGARAESRARATVRLALGDAPSDEPAIVYLPERSAPTILDVAPVGGAIEPASPRPRWICYGDSIAEGWISSWPALAWPHAAAREHGLDVANLSYAGSARGELASAEQIADLPADVIALSHGTNCWSRVPHSPGTMREGTRAFLDVLRQGHPTTPIVVVTPIVRLDGGEERPNRLGATLADLRDVIEEVVRERIGAGDANLHLVGGRDLIDASMFVDEVHPNDEGHAALAAALGPGIAKVIA